MIKLSRMPTNRSAGSKAHNAEATYTCGYCSKPIEDTNESMECEYCNLWYHTACEKIKHSDCEMLVRLKAINQLHWYCRNCNPKCTGVIKLVAEMNERQKTLTKEVDMYTQKLIRMATYEDEQFKEKNKTDHPTRDERYSQS